MNKGKNLTLVTITQCHQLWTQKALPNLSWILRVKSYPYKGLSTYFRIIKIPPFPVSVQNYCSMHCFLENERRKRLMMVKGKVWILSWSGPLVNLFDTCFRDKCPYQYVVFIERTFRTVSPVTVQYFFSLFHFFAVRCGTDQQADNQSPIC